MVFCGASSAEYETVLLEMIQEKPQSVWIAAAHGLLFGTEFFQFFPECRMAREPKDHFSAHADLFIKLLRVPFHKQAKCDGNERPPRGPNISVGVLPGVRLWIADEEFFNDQPVYLEAHFARFRVVSLARTTDKRVNIRSFDKFAKIVRPNADHISAFRTADTPVVHERLSRTSPVIFARLSLGCQFDRIRDNSYASLPTPTPMFYVYILKSKRDDDLYIG